MTGFEDTIKNLEKYNLASHKLLVSVQKKCMNKGDIKGITYNTKQLGKIVKHHTEERYFIILNKEDFPKWEPCIDSPMSSSQLKRYGEIDLGEPIEI